MVRQQRSGLHVVEHRPRQRKEHAGVRIVVLVHGSLDRSTSFSRVVRRLPDLDVVTYDRRGYHRSRALFDPEGEPFEQHVEDLVELVSDREAIVVGHSFGGDVALATAAASPDRIAAVAAYEPPLPWVSWWPHRSRELAQPDPGARAEGFFRRVVSDEAWERLTEHDREQRRADGPALVAELASLRRGSAPFDVSGIKAPVVLGRGELSVPHHRRAIDVLAESIPGAEVFEIAGARHGAHLSHPDSFASFVREAVRRSEA